MLSTADNHTWAAAAVRGQRPEVSVWPYCCWPVQGECLNACQWRIVHNGHNRSSSVLLVPHPLSIYHFLGIWAYKPAEVQCLFPSQPFQLQQTRGRRRNTHSAGARHSSYSLVIIGDGWKQREGDISGSCQRQTAVLGSACSVNLSGRGFILNHKNKPSVL